jgi:hypothetical protein
MSARDKFQGAQMIEGIRIPLGYVQETVLSAAVALSNVPVGSRYAIITAESANVRWRDDGTSPTASIGMPLADGDTLVYTGDPTKLKFIEETASAKINVSYYA